MIRSGLGTRILAVILALFLWAYVRVAHQTRDAHRIMRDVPVRVVGTVSGLAPKLHFEDRAIVVRIRGSAEQVSNALREDIEATVDVSKLTTAGEKRLPVKIKLPRRVRLDTPPPTVLVTAAPLVRRSFPVTISFIAQPPAGTPVSKYSVQPSTVIVEGEKEMLDKVKYVTVPVDPSEPMMSERDVIPRPVGADGERIKEVRVLAATVQVGLEALTGDTRQVAVRPPQLLHPPRRYTVKVRAVRPDVVTLSGPPALLDRLEGYVEAEPLDVRSITRDATRTVRLRIPQGLDIVEAPEVRVDLEVQPIQ